MSPSTSSAAPAPSLDLVRQQLDRAHAAASARVADFSGVVRLPKEAVLELPRKELRARLDQIMLARRVDAGLEYLLRAGVFAAVMPEVCALEGFGDDSAHKDVWKHTKQVVMQAVPRPSVRYAALFHDVGKPRTRSFGAGGKVQFLGHPEVGARMFDKICRRTRLFQGDDDLRKTIRFLVLHHQRPGQYAPSWTDSAVRRFARDIGDRLDELFLLSRADMTTKHREKKRRYMFQLRAFQDRILALLAEDAKVPPLPTGIGDAIMAHYGLRPCRLIGDLKRELEARVEAGDLPQQADFAVYVAYLDAHRERLGLPGAG